MKLSLPVSIFSILILSACAGEGYADNGLTGEKSSNENTDEPSSTSSDENSTPKKDKLETDTFAQIIIKDLESFKHLNQEKLSVSQSYNRIENKPISVTQHGQKITNMIIFANRNDNCGIDINGYSDVNISNVTIYHANIGVCANNAKGLKINGLKLVSLAAPTTGPHCPRSSSDGLNTEECWGQIGQPADSRLGISLKNSPNTKITHISSFQAATGVYAINSPNTKISKIRCFDMRGPFPRGQCVQFNRSSDSSINTFYAKNIYNQSHSEDNINAYLSDNIVVKNGLIDGNWSQHGVGVIADKGSDNMLVHDVDFLHISTSAVNVWSNNESETGKNFKASKLRVKDTQCFSRKNSTPSTGGLIIAAQPSAVNPIFSDIKWYNHCRPSTNWCLPGQSCRTNSSGSLINFHQEDFSTRWTSE
ncbi:MAG: hypothetical protein V3V19_07850 [Cocleimonas sp.]